jgi:hypothetical protein
MPTAEAQRIQKNRRYLRLDIHIIRVIIHFVIVSSQGPP